MRVIRVHLRVLGYTNQGGSCIHLRTLYSQFHMKLPWELKQVLLSKHIRRDEREHQMNIIKLFVWCNGHALYWYNFVCSIISPYLECGGYSMPQWSESIQHWPPELQAMRGSSRGEGLRVTLQLPASGWAQLLLGSSLVDLLQPKFVQSCGSA